jgi:hypothetical protein
MYLPLSKLLVSTSQTSHGVSNPLSSAEVKNECSYTSASPTCLCGTDREDFIFYVLYVPLFLCQYPEEGASMFNQNVGNLLPDCDVFPEAHGINTSAFFIEFILSQMQLIIHKFSVFEALNVSQ